MGMEKWNAVSVLRCLRSHSCLMCCDSIVIHRLVQNVSLFFSSLQFDTIKECRFTARKLSNLVYLVCSGCSL